MGHRNLAMYNMCVNDLSMCTTSQGTFHRLKQQFMENLQHTIDNISPSDVLLVHSMHVLDVACLEESSEKTVQEIAMKQMKISVE